MTDAPERIWTQAQPAPSKAFCSYSDKPEPIDGFVEYVRADTRAPTSREGLAQDILDANADWHLLSVEEREETKLHYFIADAILARLTPVDQRTWRDGPAPKDGFFAGIGIVGQYEPEFPTVYTCFWSESDNAVVAWIEPDKWAHIDLERWIYFDAPTSLSEPDDVKGAAQRLKILNCEQLDVFVTEAHKHLSQKYPITRPEIAKALGIAVRALAGEE